MRASLPGFGIRGSGFAYQILNSDFGRAVGYRIPAAGRERGRALDTDGVKGRAPALQS